MLRRGHGGAGSLAPPKYRAESFTPRRVEQESGCKLSVRKNLAGGREAPGPGWESAGMRRGCQLLSPRPGWLGENQAATPRRKAAGSLRGREQSLGCGRLPGGFISRGNHVIVAVAAAVMPFWVQTGTFSPFSCARGGGGDGHLSSPSLNNWFPNCFL